MHDTVGTAKKIEAIEASKRRLLGDDLESCSFSELRQLENQLDRSLTKIRARKNQLLKAQINLLKEEEKKLLQQNRKLREKCGMQPQKSPSDTLEDPRSIEEIIEVHTELAIGLPETRSD